MYSMPAYHQNRKFNQENLPETIYSMKPYYFGVSGNANDALDSEPLPSGTLPIADGIDDHLLNDSNCKMALEDLLSRQLLLFCRLNDLERNLMILNDVDVDFTKKTKSLQLIKPLELQQKQEDIVVHFDLDHPPLVLLTFLKAISKNCPEIKLLLNYHVHSSLFSMENGSDLLRKQKLFEMKLSKINFQFNPIEDNYKRQDSNLIVTFIVKKFSENMLVEDDGCYASFKTNEPIVKNELAIILKICSIISPESNNLEFCKLLLESDLNSPKVLLENLGKYFIGLNENNFLLNKPEPGLLDLIVWCLAKQSQSIVTCNTFESLIDFKWSQVIQSFII